MNIKIRFAFLFTFFVSLVLSISCFIIYILYADFREKEFYSRLNKEANYSHDLYVSKRLKNNEIQEIEKDNEFALINLSLIIFDGSQKKLYSYNDSINMVIQDFFFKKAKNEKEVKVKDFNREATLIYLKETNYFVYVSALDKYGVRKLNNIKLILIGVLTGGILLSSVISFLFVQQAFKPLKELSNQMLQTTNIEKTKPIIYKKSNDEIAQIARSYNAMIERLKKSFEYQKSFVSHASHELRTPLASMLSQTEAAIKNSLSERDLKIVLQSLKEDQQGMVELTNSLLLLSQYEHKFISEKTDFVRIDDVLLTCMEDAKKTNKDATFSLNFLNVPREEDLYINGNRSLYNSAFNNLIKNGYQYSTDKKVNVLLFADENIVEIYFENRGDLIAVDQQDKIFIPFFRADNKQKQKGHGLGLAIVQRIIQVNGGTIVYRSKPNSINCFHIQFKKQKPINF